MDLCRGDYYFDTKAVGDSLLFELLLRRMPKIIQERDKCIGCGSCATIAPDYFELDENDGLANLIKGKAAKGLFTREIKKIDSSIKEAVSICPLEIIKIKK